MKRAIVLCSGGIDSVTTAFYVKKKRKYNKVIILFFNYGQKSLVMERKFSRKCSQNLKAEFIEAKLDFLKKISTSSTKLINKNDNMNMLNSNNLRYTKKESQSFYVPLRNTIFITHAMALAESIFIKNKEKYDIFLGFKNEGKESYPDTTHEFVSQMNRLSRTVSGGIKIKAPLIKKDKEDIVLIGKKLRVDFRKTFSCYVSSGKHCGRCLACALRKYGFYWANIEDPTSYCG